MVNEINSKMVISLENIVDVTRDGLIFKDGHGDTNKILFDECRKNWVNHVNEGGFVDWQGNPAHITFEQSKCIGERNMTVTPPYLLLYSKDKLKIELKPKNYKELSKVQKELPAMLYNVGGVTTFDIT